MAYSRAERVFILEHFLGSKLFAGVREAFSSAYPDKEVPIKTGNTIPSCLREGDGHFQHLL
jgi:hypothetical protein